MKKTFTCVTWVVLSVLFSVLMAPSVQAGTISQDTTDWNAWDQVAGLPGGNAGYALAAGTLSNFMYAFGGDGLGQTNVARFDGTTWTTIVGLPTARTRLAGAVHNGTLYAIAGNSGGSTNVYAFNGSSWTQVRGLPAAREWLGAGVLGTNMYAVGGSNFTNVYRFGGQSVNWTQVRGLPVGREKLAVATLSNRLYAIGGNNSTNVYAFNGTNWTSVAGLPQGRQTLAAATFEGNIFAIAGENAGGKTNVYRYNGSTWTEAPGLPVARVGLTAAVLSNKLYAIGGSDSTNVFRYPAGVYGSGISPESGSYTGGYTVTISGSDLSDGTTGDVSSVTLCGIAASVESVNGTTQIVVTAGAASGPAIGLGDVRVVSDSEGESVKTNGFTYTGAPGLKVLGTNGAVIALGTPPTIAAGTQFDPVAPDSTINTIILKLTNSGSSMLDIDNMSLTGDGAAMFSRGGNTTRYIAPNTAASNVNISYQPTAPGLHTAVLSISNNSPTAGYDVNLRGLCYTILPTNSGPKAGGTTVTFTNSHSGIVSSVLIGGASASIVDQGTYWVSVTLPASATTGAKDVVIATDQGTFTLTSAFTYNADGYINRIIYDWDNWEEVAPLPHNAEFPSMVTYSNALYLIGGNTHTNVYRYYGGAWTEVAGLPKPTYGAAVGVVSGKVYVAGGMNPEGSGSTNSVFSFNGTSWTELDIMPDGRGLAAYGVINGWLYVALGFDMMGGLPETTYKFNGISWTEHQKSTAAVYPGLRVGSAVVGTNLYVTGGYYGGYLNYFQQLGGSNWSRPCDLPAARAWHASAALDDKVYVIGGRVAGGHKTNLVYRYNGTSWTTNVPLPRAIDSLGAATYRGSIYVAGGSAAADTNVYRYPAQSGSEGVIPDSGVRNGGYQVTISGLNLGNGADITDVTLCGVSASSIVSQSATQVVIVAGASGSDTTGDVQVVSTTYGTTVLTNGFAYAGTGKDQQTITFPEIGNQTRSSVVRLAATASSGLPVSFSVVSGPATLSGGTNLSFTSEGSVSVKAAQAGNVQYDPAPDVVRSFFVIGTFSFRAVALTNSVVLRWSSPGTIGFSNQNVLVRYDTSDYPDTTADGSSLYTGTNVMYTHDDLTPGQPYYYTVFFSHNGSSFTNPP